MGLLVHPSACFTTSSTNVHNDLTAVNKQTRQISDCSLPQVSHHSVSCVNITLTLG